MGYDFSEIKGEMLLNDQGASLNERIVDFYLNEDGTWDVVEGCDGYFGARFSREQIIQLAEHLLRLAK